MRPNRKCRPFLVKMTMKRCLAPSRRGQEPLGPQRPPELGTRACELHACQLLVERGVPVPRRKCSLLPAEPEYPNHPADARVARAKPTKALLSAASIANGTAAIWDPRSNRAPWAEVPSRARRPVFLPILDRPAAETTCSGGPAAACPSAGHIGH